MTGMKKRFIVGAAVIFVLGLVGYFALVDRSTPAGQPPLVEMNGQVRVIALLSPT